MIENNRNFEIFYHLETVLLFGIQYRHLGGMEDSEFITLRNAQLQQKINGEANGVLRNSS